MFILCVSSLPGDVHTVCVCLRYQVMFILCVSSLPGDVHTVCVFVTR